MSLDVDDDDLVVHTKTCQSQIHLKHTFSKILPELLCPYLYFFFFGLDNPALPAEMRNVMTRKMADQIFLDFMNDEIVYDKFLKNFCGHERRKDIF